MARETKFGLLIGLVVILLFGLLVSDYLQPIVQGDEQGDPTALARDAQQSIDPLAARMAPRQPPRYDEAMYGEGGEGGGEEGVVVQPIPAAGPARDAVWTPAPVAPVQGGGEGGDGAASPVIGAPPPVQHRQAWAVADRDAQFQRAMAQVGPLPEGAQPQTLPAPRTEPRSLPLDAPTPGPDADTPTPDPLPAPAGSMIHEVREGDTLTAVARRYYGDDRLWRTIADANPQQILPGYRLRPGTRLTVPALPPLPSAFTPEMAEHFEIVTTDRRPPASAAVTVTAGPAMPQVDRPAPPPMTPVVTVTVAAGDTLIKLASRHLGEGDRWQELLDANRDQIIRPEQLREGMTLKLPATATTATTPHIAVTTPDPTPTPQSVRPSPQPAKMYTVQSGDNLTRIARRTLGDDDAWRAIYDANRDTLTSPDAVVVGQTLRIPTP